MQILPLIPEMCLDAAELFCQVYAQQRQAAPLLSAEMENPQHVASLLSAFQGQQAIVALDDGLLVGYLGWYEVDEFRRSSRRGAYVPEWGHAAADLRKDPIYRALYRGASQIWMERECRVHAITILAQDNAAEWAWFWNGFGLAVVDAIRSAAPLAAPPHTSLQIRKANQEDTAVLAALDMEHRRHYSQPPIFMPANPGDDEGAFAAFLSDLPNSVWLALDDGQPVGFMRFEGKDFDGVAVFDHPNTVMITGAYVRPAYRRQNAAVTLLDAALRDYQSQGLAACAVDFESFNPEAAAFWPRYYDPVCFSLMRIPEN